MFDGEPEQKIWGLVRHLFDGPVSVSLLRVEAGTYCSTHYHERRWNLFHVIRGRIAVVIYEESGTIYRTILKHGDRLKVPPGVKHRFEVLENGQVVEVYWTDDGSPVSPSDIVRFDVGGRF